MRHVDTENEGLNGVKYGARFNLAQAVRKSGMRLVGDEAKVEAKVEAKAEAKVEAKVEEKKEEKKEAKVEGKSTEVEAKMPVEPAKIDENSPVAKEATAKE